MKGYKTLAFALLTALVPILSMAEVVDLIPAQYMNYYLIGVAVVTAVLRVLTNSKIGGK